MKKSFHPHELVRTRNKSSPPRRHFWHVASTYQTNPLRLNVMRKYRLETRGKTFFFFENLSLINIHNRGHDGIYGARRSLSVRRRLFDGPTLRGINSRAVSLGSSAIKPPTITPSSPRQLNIIPGTNPLWPPNETPIH